MSEVDDRRVESVEDPIEYFLQDIVFHGRSERTRDAYERVLRGFERHLADEWGIDRPGAAGQRECMAWVHSLRGEHAPSTIATYASYLHRFYAYMTQVGAFDSNPMTLVMAEMTETIETDPVRREISIKGMRTFLADVTHPLDRAVILTLLKTGIRVGELVNLDVRDLRIDDEDVEAAYDLSGRPQLAERPNSLFVASDIARGDVVNGEERTASNKRKRATVIPVDDELRRALVGWLAIRPDALSPAEPLFLSTSDRWGERLTTPMVRAIVKKHAAEMNWYRAGGSAEENVTPHYFRHFFTTYLRDRAGDRGIVKYLRGDVADDIIDTYTHNWGDRVRDTYERRIYRLL